MLASLQDDPVRLLREILMGWWELIGATDLGGIPKVMIAEAHNFPEVARYFNEDVISRGRAVVASALRLGIERGLFRVVDVPATVQVLMAPLIMLSVWRNSMAVCDPAAWRPEVYLPAYFDVVFKGLLTGPDSGVLP